jgi:ParB/RepB/Spo0J family partition protein
LPQAKEKKLMPIQVDIKKIEESLSVFRLTRPEQIRKMESSLEQVGQLQGVVVRKQGDSYQLLDGFKRYYAALALGWDKLDVHQIQADDITAKRLIINYNQQGSSLVDYEEAQIVHSLHQEHGLQQKHIAILLSKSASWVSRRLSFIQRLSPEVGTHLQLGQITLTHARELLKLPRGKQEAFLRMIIVHQLTSRQTGLLVSRYLQCKSKEEQDYLLSCPFEVLARTSEDSPIHDCRLGKHGNQLLLSTRLLARQQHIFIGQTSHPPMEELPPTELEILRDGLTDVIKKAKMIQSILTKHLLPKDER